MKFLRLEKPKEFRDGVGIVEDVPATEGYPTTSSMSALAAFPYVRACLDAKMEDVSGLPYYIERDGQKVENHPILEILKEPALGWSWELFVRQLILDYTLSGNAYVLLQGLDTPAPAMIRVHPNSFKPVPDSFGLIKAFEHTELQKYYSHEDVLHFRTISWADDSSKFLGEGLIRALHDDLTASKAAKEFAAKQAKSGRFEFLISPEDGQDTFSSHEMQEIQDRFKSVGKTGSRMMILGRAVTVQTLSLTPRDLEYSEMSARTREAILAVFSVPPARIGLETANYATQVQQMMTYWQGLKGLTKIFSNHFSKVAAQLSGNKNDTFRFDFSGVQSLQEARTAQLARAAQWVGMGFNPEESAKLEGFETPPPFDGFGFGFGSGGVEGADSAEEGSGFSEEEEEGPPEEGSEKIHRGIDQVEQKRVQIWREWVPNVQGKAERQLGRKVNQFLSRQLEKALEVIGETEQLKSKIVEHQKTHKSSRVYQKGLIDDLISEIFDGQDEQFTREIGGVLERIARVGFSEASKGLPVQLIFGESRSKFDNVALSVSGLMSQTTKETVRAILSKGLDEDSTIQEMQKKLQENAQFSASRASMVARTESAKTINEATDSAYTQAKRKGVRVKKQWLSAKDGKVRPLHQALDGKTVDTEDRFSAQGRSAPYPGGFGVAGQDINCRCTILPIVEK